MPLSSGEVQFILDGVSENIRSDGRGRLDHRYVIIETGVSAQNSGSARCKLGDTDIMVGVSVALEAPKQSKPDQGKLEFSVKCSPVAGVVPPAGSDIEDLQVQLSRTLEKTVSNSGAIDCKALCLVKGLQCWSIYVDVLVLGNGGNLIDAASIACKAALKTTTIPSVDIIPGEKPGDFELDLDDDPDSAKLLQCDNMPVCVTVCQVGTKYIVDPNLDEECCVSASIILAVTDAGKVISIQKIGGGGVNPAAVNDMVQTGKRVGAALNGKIGEALKREKEEDKGAPIGLMME